MEQDRLDFVFGAGADLSAEIDDLRDLDQRSSLYDDLWEPDLGTLQRAVRDIVANQILDGDPPEVWATVQRLQAAGLERDDIFNQLVLVLVPLLEPVVIENEPFDDDAYLAGLASLPLSAFSQVESMLLDAVRASPGIDAGDAVVVAMERLGRPDDPVTETLVEHVLDHLLRSRQLVFVGPDHVAVREQLLAGVVLTHVLTAEEIHDDALDVTFDLNVLADGDDLTLPSGDVVELEVVGERGLRWVGPAGWLGSHRPGTVIAVSVTPERQLQITVLDLVPPVPDSFVALVGAMYVDLNNTDGMPVLVDDLVFRLRHADPVFFADPTAPLQAVVERAGLEVRANEMANDPGTWHQGVKAERFDRVHQTLGSDGAGASTIAVLQALDVADLTAGMDPTWTVDVEAPVGPELLQSVLDDLGDDDVLMIVGDELTAVWETGFPRRAEAFAAALLEVAKKPRHVAAARYLAAIAHEQQGEPLVALQQLELAHEADTRFDAVTDRLAWYAFDRGDAARARRLWRPIADRFGRGPELEILDAAAAPSGPTLGRNEPCWCGSGRKYKQCHLGVSELPSLPERVSWLHRKSVGFVMRSGALAPLVVEVARAMVDDPEDLAAAAEEIDDQLLMDLVLTEGGGFAAFLEARGALLPDDEALLATSWLLVPRTVYEVAEVRSGEGMTVRDLRTGDRVEVRERTASPSMKAGMLVCARAVPDGVTHQFVGTVRSIPPGREQALLEVLDRADPEEIGWWFAALDAPPTIRFGGGAGELTLSGLDLEHADIDELMAAVQEQMEERWCDEPVPALGDITPRQAAADPTRRAELERLIDSFAGGPLPEGAVSQRPERLRELLGMAPRR